MHLPPSLVVALALLGQWSYLAAERKQVEPAQKRADLFPRQAEKVAEKLRGPEPAPKPATPAPKAPTNATPVFEWRRFSANPAYEIWGSVDKDGVFRYTAFRLASPAAVITVPAVQPPQPPAYEAFCPPGGS